MQSSNFSEETFLQPEEYPAWHPAARGIAQDLPHENGVDAATSAPATPYTGKNLPVEPIGQQQRPASTESVSGTNRYTKRRNPNHKKGFRRPPAKYAATSPFAPAIGAASAGEPDVQQKRPRSTPLFREGSALNEPVSDEAMLLQGVTPLPEPGQGRRRAKEPESEFSRAKNVVLNQLAASPKSRSMLYKKLVEKEISEPVIEDVLARCEAVGLVNDAEFADVYVRTRMNVKKLSRSAIRRELKQKGVEGETAEIALEQRTDDDERNDAHELVRKKLRPSMDLADRQEKDKIMRRLVAMLARKGYPSGLAFSVVKQEIETYIEENGIENSSSGSYYD